MSEESSVPAASMDALVALCKRRGFIFQSSEIYGGINGFWDYGPLGAELKRNVKELWWNTIVRQRDDVAGLDPLTLRRRVGMVFQRPTLFAGTVRDNLRVARPDGTASITARTAHAAAARHTQRRGLGPSCVRNRTLAFIALGWKL